MLEQQEPVKASMYEIAKAHIDDDGLSEDMEKLLSDIIKFVEEKDNDIDEIIELLNKILN